MQCGGLKLQYKNIFKILEFSKNWYNHSSEKIFFNLKKLKNQIAPRTEGDLRNEHVKDIANRLDVSERWSCFYE